MEEIEKLLATADPPDLGPGPRAGIQSAASLARTLDDSFRRNQLPRQKQQLIRALILLWHDHLEAAHGIAQDIEDADGAFVHGIVHRREPDYSNARYWFHRVGRHAAFPEIATAVSALFEGCISQVPPLTDSSLSPSEGERGPFAPFCSYPRDSSLLEANHDTRLRSKLIPQGQWDAMAFIDACSSGEDKGTLRKIQAIETRALLKRFCG